MTPELRLVPVLRAEDLPAKIGEYFEKKLAWYHAQGKHLEVTTEVMLQRCPTFLVTLDNGGTILIQKRGVGYKDFAIDVFNEDGVITDARNYLYLAPGENAPDKWPDGTPVTNCAQAFEFIPPFSGDPKFEPPK